MSIDDWMMAGVAAGLVVLLAVMAVTPADHWWG